MKNSSEVEKSNVLTKDRINECYNKEKDKNKRDREELVNKLIELSNAYIKSGGKLYTLEEINKELC